MPTIFGFVRVFQGNYIALREGRRLAALPTGANGLWNILRLRAFIFDTAMPLGFSDLFTLLK